MAYALQDWRDPSSLSMKKENSIEKVEENNGSGRFSCFFGYDRCDQRQRKAIRTETSRMSRFLLSAQLS